MPLSAVIGALRVVLGLDSAQFTTGLKEAQTGLGSFSKAAGVGLAAVAAAATAAGVALAGALKIAIDHADELGKAAQRAGVTTEALSRLAYAASYSGVSLDEMTASLGKLSKSMVEASQNTNTGAASAFAALGINIKDAAGNLQSSDAVFSAIADRFAKLPDSATKTALALQLFGKSGAQLIPVLNEGAEGLKRYADESDRIGTTISGATANAANHFNDTLSKIGDTLTGVTDKVMEAALPALQQFADMLASPGFAKAAQTLATNVVSAMTLIADAITGVINMLGDLSNKITDSLNYATRPEAQKSTDELKKDIADYQAMLTGDKTLFDRYGTTQRLSEAQTELANRSKPLSADAGVMPESFDFASFFAGQAKVTGGSGDGAPNLGLYTNGLKQAAAAIDPFSARMQDLSEVLTKSHDPFRQMQDDLTDLGTMFKAGKITAQQYGDAVAKTNLNAVGSFADMAAGVSGALADLFKNNKGFAVSNAILQGLSGVAYALGSSPPPWNFINAAAVGIEAAANVANILSTTETSTSMPGSAGSAVASQALPAAATPPASAVNVTLQGGGRYSRDEVLGLIADINSAIGDGASLRVA